MAHRIALDLNNVQASYMAQAAGTVRSAYSAGCQACGEEGPGCHHKTAVKPASLKQELSAEPV